MCIPSCLLYVYRCLYNRNTVFSPIEAPGAKEMVWGASIFHPETPNFEINMAKKDSEKYRIFQPQNTHQCRYKVQGKNPLRVYKSTFHCYYSTTHVENTVYNVQFLHQSMQLNYNPCPYLSKNKGGGFYWKGASIGENTVYVLIKH